MGLVGDIGGTNMRLALAVNSGAAIRLLSCRTFSCADFASFEEIIALYAHQAGTGIPDSVAIAVAGPVENGMASLTNGRWNISEKALLQFGFGRVKLVNDFMALALAVRHLLPADVAVIGDDIAGIAGEPIGIVGAGTGLGVAILVPNGTAPIAVATEGGHMSFAPDGETEIEILRLLTQRFGHVSVERVLSGPGLTNLHWALARMNGGEPDQLSPAEITNRAAAGADLLCVEAVDRFCSIYGRFAGDIALAYGARGGMYLAGGIAPRLLQRLRTGAFRQDFERKGRFSTYVAKIPTKVIIHPYAALLGASNVLGRVGSIAWPDIRLDVSVVRCRQDLSGTADGSAVGVST